MGDDMRVVVMVDPSQLPVSWESAPSLILRKPTAVLGHWVRPYSAETAETAETALVATIYGYIGDYRY